MSNIEYILLYVSTKEIPGILPTAGYINALEYSPEELANNKEKIDVLRDMNSFRRPDLLYKNLKAKSKNINMELRG
jgi:hypothetical protein